jgi:hypothetical protein
MLNLCTFEVDLYMLMQILCKFYVDFMQCLCRFMRSICRVYAILCTILYAEFMQFLCILFMDIILCIMLYSCILCNLYAIFMHVLCNFQVTHIFMQLNRVHKLQNYAVYAVYALGTLLMSEVQLGCQGAYGRGRRPAPGAAAPSDAPRCSPLPRRWRGPQAWPRCRPVRAAAARRSRRGSH